MNEPAAALLSSKPFHSGDLLTHPGCMFLTVSINVLVMLPLPWNKVWHEVSYFTLWCSISSVTEIVELKSMEKQRGTLPLVLEQTNALTFNHIYISFPIQQFSASFPEGICRTWKIPIFYWISKMQILHSIFDRNLTHSCKKLITSDEQLPSSKAIFLGMDIDTKKN